VAVVDAGELRNRNRTANVSSASYGWDSRPRAMMESARAWANRWQRPRGPPLLSASPLAGPSCAAITLARLQYQVICW